MDKTYLINKLENGLSTRDIEKDCGLNHRTISYWINKYNLNELSQYKKNDSFEFGKIDSKEKAYALGFILCDSGIDIKNNVEISISSMDKEVLEVISTIINSNIHCQEAYDKRNKKTYYKVRTSKRIKDITKFTGGTKKEDRHYPRVREDLERYLIQGVFDADGCITFGRRKDKNRLWHKICFASSYKILYGVQQFLFNYLEIPSRLYERKDENCFELEFHKRQDIIKFLDFIYQDDFIPLKRKYFKSQALRLELEDNGEVSE